MKYIKIIQYEAEPMPRGTYDESLGFKTPSDKDPDEDGFLVVHPDGYTSWCPCDEIGDFGRPCSGMTFGMALEAMRKGFKVCRKGWNSKECWLSIPLVDGPKVISSRGIWGARNKDSLNVNGLNATVMPYITRMDGKGRIVMGWIPTSIDMLSDDWIIVE